MLRSSASGKRQFWIRHFVLSKPRIYMKAKCVSRLFFEAIFPFTCSFTSHLDHQAPSFHSLLVRFVFLFPVNVRCRIASFAQFIWFIRLVVCLTVTSVKLVMLGKSHSFRSCLDSLNTSCEVCVCVCTLCVIVSRYRVLVIWWGRGMAVTPGTWFSTS